MVVFELSYFGSFYLPNHCEVPIIQEHKSRKFCKLNVKYYLRVPKFLNYLIGKRLTELKESNSRINKSSVAKKFEEQLAKLKKRPLSVFAISR